MGNLGWFMAGFLTSQAIALVIATGPNKAMQNLREWVALFLPRKGT